MGVKSRQVVLATPQRSEHTGASGGGGVAGGGGVVASTTTGMSQWTAATIKKMPVLRLQFSKNI